MCWTACFLQSVHKTNVYGCQQAWHKELLARTRASRMELFIAITYCHLHLHVLLLFSVPPPCLSDLLQVYLPHCRIAHFTCVQAFFFFSNVLPSPSLLQPFPTPPVHFHSQPICCRSHRACNLIPCSHFARAVGRRCRARRGCAQRNQLFLIHGYFARVVVVVRSPTAHGLAHRPQKLHPPPWIPPSRLGRCNGVRVHAGTAQWHGGRQQSMPRRACVHERWILPQPGPGLIVRHLLEQRVSARHGLAPQHPLRRQPHVHQQHLLGWILRQLGRRKCVQRRGPADVPEHLRHMWQRRLSHCVS
eukprot:m.471461 g.471461  ORF g.471461 m.471461 type:complete len:303 (-) comp21658_c0_seq25:994-1902(-)